LGIRSASTSSPICDRPMTEEEWIKERGATVVDVTPTPIEDKLN
jgi:hypothetical protein